MFPTGSTPTLGAHTGTPTGMAGMAAALDRITGLLEVFVRGRLGIASPLGVAWRLARQI
jgi:hypothetical protein